LIKARCENKRSFIACCSQSAAAPVRLLAPPYIITEEEWQNSQIIRATQVDEGEEWKPGFLFRAGAQIPIGIR
jgi:hypothetical protein